MSRIQVRDGFLVLMAALWCADKSGVLPIFLLAAAVHECGHLFVIRLSGGTMHALCLTLLGLFNLLPVPPLDGGMALRHLADGRCAFLLDGVAGVSVLVLLAGGVLLWKSGFGGWLLLAGLMVAVSFGRA